ncbi:MAG TPA: hypothetical protein VEO01_09055 [Pseudonocardiaceae bacterium]|nr:hypothetical protein [Pseudonocardiaceae bacterium]
MSAKRKAERDMLRAVFVRTLKPGVSYEQFCNAWVPETDVPYPAKVSISSNVANERQVITIIELDTTPERFTALRDTLTRPDGAARIAELVESTELEGLYDQVLDDSAL